MDYDIFELGDLALQRGGVLRGAKLAYKTYGAPDAKRTNAIVVPTAYGGTHVDNEWMIGPGKALDTDRYFVISPNLFGAGLSSSPSNTPEPQGRGAFPEVTVYDNVFAQQALVRDLLGMRKIALVTGFSMGGQQTYHWACAFPELVERIAPICGSATTAQHNIVFLDGIKAALTCDPAFRDGWYDAPPVTGLATVARVWAGWGLSQTFYREERWRAHDFASRDACVQSWYLDSFGAADANNLLAMLWTWQHADVGAHPSYGGDAAAALAAIRARAVVMPSATDLYFPPEDSELEVAAMRDATFSPIPSVYGHAAGGGSNDADNAFISGKIAQLLAETAA
jgi:homoserine O-acetyltransferase